MIAKGKICLIVLVNAHKLLAIPLMFIVGNSPFNFSISIFMKLSFVQD